MVQMFMRDLKKVSTLWNVHFRVSSLERFCFKGFLRNSSRPKFFVCLREVAALENLRFSEVPLYFNCRNLSQYLKKLHKSVSVRNGNLKF